MVLVCGNVVVNLDCNLSRFTANTNFDLNQYPITIPKLQKSLVTGVELLLVDRYVVVRRFLLLVGNSFVSQVNNRETYKNNPRYTITAAGVESETYHMLIKLEAPRKYSVGLSVAGTALNSPTMYVSWLNSPSFSTDYLPIH